MPFDLSVARFFLTFPQCDYDPEEFLNNAKRLEHYKSCAVVRERHADGEPHLHAVLCFTKRRHVRRPDWFDHLAGGAHGNVQRVRNLRASYDYLRKAGEPCTDGVNLALVEGRRGAVP